MSKPGDLDWLLDQAVVEGRATREDADEIKRFAAYLEDAGPPPGHPDHNHDRAVAAFHKHYPEETG